MPYTPPPDIQSLDVKALEQLVAGQAQPPVHEWQPEASSDSHMRIDSDGRWYHRGDEITRDAMVRLFSTIMRREADGRYALVTPYEKQFIAVEDAPFLAVELSVQRQDRQHVLTFRLNTDTVIIAGNDHPLRIKGPHNDPRFYLTVRPGLEARLSRNAHYDLVNLIIDQSPDTRTYQLDYGGPPLLLDLTDMEDAL